MTDHEVIRSLTKDLERNLAMIRQKTMQLPATFFYDVKNLITDIQYDLDYIPGNIAEQLHSLSVQIAEKEEAQARREEFSAYRSSPIGTVEREAHRQKYLDKVGISPSFRTHTETTS